MRTLPETPVDPVTPFPTPPGVNLRLRHAAGSPAGQTLWCFYTRMPPMRTGPARKREANGWPSHDFEEPPGDGIVSKVAVYETGSVGNGGVGLVAWWVW